MRRRRNNIHALRKCGIESIILAMVIFPFLIRAQDKSGEMVKIPSGSFIMGMDYFSLTGPAPNGTYLRE